MSSKVKEVLNADYSKRTRNKPYVFSPTHSKIHYSKQIDNQKCKPRGVLVNHETKTINIDINDKSNLNDDLYKL